VKYRISTYVPEIGGDVVLVGATKNATIDSWYWFSWFGCLQLLERVNRLLWEAIDLLRFLSAIVSWSSLFVEFGFDVLDWLEAYSVLEWTTCTVQSVRPLNEGFQEVVFMARLGLML
jgi:hypothetical protein